MDTNITIKEKIVTAITNCDNPCNGICNQCPYDGIRFEFGFSFCKKDYKEQLIKDVQDKLQD